MWIQIWRIDECLRIYMQKYNTLVICFIYGGELSDKNILMNDLLSYYKKEVLKKIYFKLGIDNKKYLNC